MSNFVNIITRISARIDEMAMAARQAQRLIFSQSLFYYITRFGAAGAIYHPFTLLPARHARASSYFLLMPLAIPLFHFYYARARNAAQISLFIRHADSFEAGVFRATRLLGRIQRRELLSCYASIFQRPRSQLAEGAG